MDSETKRQLRRLDVIEKMERAKYETHLRYNDVADGSPWSKTAHMDNKLRRAQGYALRKVFEELDHRINDIRFNGDAKIPADIDAYIANLMKQIPERVEDLPPPTSNGEKAPA